MLKPIIAQGRTNVERYKGKYLSLSPSEASVVVPLDFVYTEQKKASLFFQTPEVRAEADLPQYEDTSYLFSAVMNQELGQKGVDLKSTMFELLTDVLCPTGFGASKIGYYPTVNGTKPVQVGTKPVAQPPMPGSVLGLQAPPPVEEPVFEQVPNVVAERYAWDRFPPGWFRCPSDFRGSDFDKAAWLAMRFEEDVKDGDESRTRKGSSDQHTEMLLSVPPNGQAGQPQTPKRGGVEVWYKAALFDDDAVHPEHVRTFKLYDDEQDKSPARRDSPFQRWAQPPVEGQPPAKPSERYEPGAQPVGMIGFPLHVLTLRYLPDAAFPPSDCTMSRQTVDEINTGRTQMLRRRDRSLPQVGYDATRVGPDQLQKIEAGENTGMIGFNGPIGDAFAPINKGQFGRENFEFNDIGQRDLDMIWTLGAAAGVLGAEGSETATKSNQIKSAIDTRMEAERVRVLEFVMKGVNKLAALKQLFATADDYVKVVGPQGAELMKWNADMIAGRWAFTARPNSHIRLDAVQASTQAMTNYNQMRKDANVNPEYLIKSVAEKLSLDPARLYVPPQPPQPPAPTISWAIKVEDFAGPAAPIAVLLAQKAGVQIPPQVLQQVQAMGAQYAAQQADAEMQAQAAKAQQAQQMKQAAAGEASHGGAATVTSPINKHNEQRTGGVQGVGVM